MTATLAAVVAAIWAIAMLGLGREAERRRRDADLDRPAPNANPALLGPWWDEDEIVTDVITGETSRWGDLKTR